MLDLISQPIEYKDDVIDSRYRLVIAAAKRTRQIMEGNAPTQNWPYHKETTVGLAEILFKKVSILTGAAAVLAEQKHRETIKAALRHEEYVPLSRGYAKDSAEAIRADVSVYQAESDLSQPPVEEDPLEDDKEI
jgi:DNA-directed RNA polymerase subunit omega